MRRQSWQVMEAKLYCAHVSLYDAIFFLTSYVNVCQSVQSQGLQMSPPPTCLTLCLVGKFAEGCGVGLLGATCWFSLNQCRSYC